jgi:spermidine synthase
LGVPHHLRHTIRSVGHPRINTLFEFEELAFHDTTLGELSLRRRSEPRAGNVIVYEVKLNEEFLMSSLFTASEEALAELGLAALKGDSLEVVVGGLGLGYTAATALKDDRVSRLWVIDKLSELIGWHMRALVPLGKTLTDDSRCHLVHADFFEFARVGSKLLATSEPTRTFDAILLDIDHSPTHWLTASNSSLYSVEGLTQMATHIRPEGVFALWSNDPPSQPFVERLEGIFATLATHVVSFPNPYTNDESACTVYVATR